MILNTDVFMYNVKKKITSGYSHNKYRDNVFYSQSWFTY